jgi:AcrR family transcriptional regulator
LAEKRQSTQDRLLDAAESLFAARGFEDVSIRDLAAAAAVNVAAVNYHFQGKENLFHEVVQRRFVAQRDRTLASLDDLLAETGGCPRVDQVIRTLVREHLTEAVPGPGKISFMALMAQHLRPGHPQLSGPFFQTLVAPVYGAFSRSLMAARPGLEAEQVSWIAASIIGQIHHLTVRWHIRQGMENDPESLQIMLEAFPALGRGREEYIDQVTEHITRFSTAAIDGLFPEVSS